MATAYMRARFPVAEMCRWLGRSPLRFDRREVSVHALKRGTDEKIIMRFLSFSDAAELATFLRRNEVTRVDIGGIYTAPPRDRDCYPHFSVSMRELVFDIDADLYADARSCCGTQKTACPRCFPLLATAVTVLQHLLTDVLGFERVLWVYSGGKGFHCWVCDDRALMLTAAQRDGLCWHLCLAARGAGGSGGRPESPDDADPAIADVLDRILVPFFRGPYAREHAELAEEALRHCCGSERAAAARVAWPRCDVPVTRDPGHLLKAPFCVHPSTGRVCVPVDPARVADFDPDSVPTVTADGGCSDEAALAEAVRQFGASW